MIEAAMIWNEPNNKSHWDLEADPDWRIFARTAALAGAAIAAEAPGLPRVLGGMSPIDPTFLKLLADQGGLDTIDAVAVHGFPLDWNHWLIGEWPDKLKQVAAVTHLPVWVSEAGVSSFGAEEVQEWGLRRTHELLHGRTPRIHWYSLYDLPAAWPATTRHKEAEGSSYFRHFHMGLFDEHGQAKRAGRIFHELTPDLGLCQWFHFEDHRLDDAVRHMKALGVDLSAHRPELGRCVPARRARLVRPPDAGAGGFSGHCHLLFHAGAQGYVAALHGTTAGSRGIRRVLWRDDPPLRARGDDAAAAERRGCARHVRAGRRGAFHLMRQVRRKMRR